MLNIQLGTAASITPINPLGDLDPSFVNRSTIVRTIIEVLLYTDGMANSIDGAVNIDIGLGVSSVTAATANVHADPSLGAEFPRDGWIFRTRRVVANQQQSGTVEMWSFARVHEDIRSQRKLDRGEEFLAINSSVSSGTGFTVRISGIIRTLLLT